MKKLFGKENSQNVNDEAAAIVREEEIAKLKKESAAAFSSLDDAEEAEAPSEELPDETAEEDVPAETQADAEDEQKTLDSDEKPEPLCSYTFFYTPEECKKYVAATMFPSISKGNLIFSIVIAVLGIIMGIYNGKILLGVAMFAAAAFIFFSSYIIYFIKRARYMSANKRLWNRRMDVRLYEEYFEVDTYRHLEKDEPPIMESFSYDDIYKIQESYDRIYMTVDSRHIIAASKNALPIDICEAILDLK